jgi:hypothetical protein
MILCLVFLKELIIIESGLPTDSEVSLYVLFDIVLCSSCFTTKGDWEESVL